MLERCRRRKAVDSRRQEKTERPSGCSASVCLCPDRVCLDLRISLENDVADTTLGSDIVNRSQEGKAAPLAVHRVLTRGERHGPATARSALPDSEANELQPGEHAVVEVQFGVGQFSGRVALF